MSIVVSRRLSSVVSPLFEASTDTTRRDEKREVECWRAVAHSPRVQDRYPSPRAMNPRHVTAPFGQTVAYRNSRFLASLSV